MNTVRSPLASLEALSEKLRSLRARPQHERLIARAWLGRAAWPGPGDARLPRALADALPEIRAELSRLARPALRSQGRDGAASKLLVELSDGETVETVVLPKDGVCVSTQVGCAVGCAFCMTGRGGLRRQLGSAEIVAQVAAARAVNPGVRKVDFMGMGEPAHNLKAVLSAVQYLAAYGDFGHKALMISTSGDRRLFSALTALSAAEAKPALAVSLHSTFDEKRRALMPRAPDVSVAELAALARSYAEASRNPVQFEWVLIRGVNDGMDEAERLCGLLSGWQAMLNVIPVNPVEGTGFERPGKEACLAFVSRVREAGIVAKIRLSAAQDVDGGCGQLRSRAIREGRAVLPRG